MKCLNCGNDVTGKFCPNCGTPVPQEDVAVKAESATQPTNATTESYASASTNFGADSYNSQPAQPTPQPFDYSAVSNQPNGMPVNNDYTGQQFTNVPNNTMPNQPKKGMSGGKIAVIVISIILGIIIILGVVIGLVACSVAKGVKSEIDSLTSQYSSFNEDVSSFASDVYSDYYSSSDDDDYYDEASCCYYEIIKNNEISITGINMYEYVKDEYAKNIEVKLPSEIDGKKVTYLYSAYVYNPTYNSDKEVSIKVIVPGSVKIVDEYAFLDCDCLTEVVFEDGVEEIQEEAIVECNDIKKITVPASVTYIGDYALGFVSSDGESFDYKSVADLSLIHI